MSRLNPIIFSLVLFLDNLRRWLNEEVYHMQENDVYSIRGILMGVCSFMLKYCNS